MFEENERCNSHYSQPATSRAMNDLQSTTESRSLREVSKKIQDAYKRIVFWEKNFFMLPTGAAAKKYITETTKLMNGCTNDSPLKDIAFKAIHIMPSLLL